MAAAAHDRDAHRTLARIAISASRTVPDHDAVNGSWPQTRAEAYARSAARAGRTRDPRTERQSARRLTTVFRAALVGTQRHGIRADRILKEACRPDSLLPVAISAGSVAADPCWTLHDALKEGVVAACSDPSILHAIAFRDAAPRAGARDAAVVVCAWRDDDRIHLRATAMAGGVLGLRSFVLHLDGTLDGNAEENHNSRHSDDLSTVLPVLTASVAECLTGIPDVAGTERITTATGGIADQDYRTDSCPQNGVEAGADVTSVQDSTSAVPLHEPGVDPLLPVESPLLTQDEADALTIIMEGNAVTRRLLREIWPMLRSDERDDPSVRPFDAIAARRAVEDGRVDELLEVLKRRSDAEASDLTKAGRIAEADAVRARAKKVLLDTSRPHVVARAAREYAELEPLHSAASRLLGDVTRMADDSLSETVEPLDEHATIDLRAEQASAGVHVVRSTDLVQALSSDGIGGSASSLFPVVVIHSSDGDGCCALALQLTEGRITSGAYRSIDADGSGPIDDDLTWQLARVVAAARSTTIRASPDSETVVPTKSEGPTVTLTDVAGMPDDGTGSEKHPLPHQIAAEEPFRHETDGEALADPGTVAPIVDERLSRAGLSVEMLSGFFDEDPDQDDGSETQTADEIGTEVSATRSSRTSRRLSRHEIVEIVEEAIRPLDERLDRIERLLQRIAEGEGMGGVR